MFSGIGGFELGINNAYETLSTSFSDKREICAEQTDDGLMSNNRCNNMEKPLCVGYSEIDKYAVQIYQSHFPEHKNYGDITRIVPEELPDFDLICGGFPCQAFSIAGKRGGFNDTRGTLFFEVARIAQAKRPRLVFLENVKGLLSHDGGRTFQTIIATLDELGYDVQWQVLNSKDFGVPQNRERVFIIGHLRGTARPQVFPLGATDKAYSRELTSNTIDANYWKGIDDHGARTAIIQLNSPIHSNDRIYSPDGISPTLNTMQGGNRQPFVALVRDGLADDTQTDPEGVREASGIPRLVDKVSETQRYKCLGNAVTVNVIKAIAERLA